MGHKGKQVASRLCLFTFPCVDSKTPKLCVPSAAASSTRPWTLGSGFALSSTAFGIATMAKGCSLF